MKDSKERLRSRVRLWRPPVVRALRPKAYRRKYQNTEKNGLTWTKTQYNGVVKGVKCKEW